MSLWNRYFIDNFENVMGLVSVKHNDKLVEFSEFLISYFYQLDNPISQLKLQKILYYIQAWNLVHFDDDLWDEAPQAWVNGPVYRTIYDKYKSNGHGIISPEDNEDFTQKVASLNLSSEQLDLLDAVLHRYGKMSPLQLVYKTHAELPWNEAREGLEPFEISSKDISYESIKSFYRSMLTKS